MRSWSKCPYGVSFVRFKRLVNLGMSVLPWGDLLRDALLGVVFAGVRGWRAAACVVCIQGVDSFSSVVGIGAMCGGPICGDACGL